MRPPTRRPSPPLRRTISTTTSQRLRSGGGPAGSPAPARPCISYPRCSRAGPPSRRAQPCVPTPNPTNQVLPAAAPDGGQQHGAVVQPRAVLLLRLAVSAWSKEMRGPGLGPRFLWRLAAHSTSLTLPLLAAAAVREGAGSLGWKVMRNRRLPIASRSCGPPALQVRHVPGQL